MFGQTSFLAAAATALLLSSTSCVGVAANAVALQSRQGNGTAYRNPALPPAERAADLLARMTWEEKIGQLGGIRKSVSRVDGLPSFNRSSFESIRETQNGNLGEFVGFVQLHDKGYESLLTNSTGLGMQFNYASDVLPIVNELRAEQVNSTRLGIPYITITDSVNGVWVSGGTLFPGTVTMSCSWNLPLFEQVVGAIRDENLALGVTWVLSPEVDIARDPRNGRNNEM